MRVGPVGVAVGRELARDPAALRVVEPARPLRRLGQHAQRRPHEQHGRQPARDEQRLPVRQAEQAVRRQQPACERARHDARDRLRKHEQSDHARTVAHRKPLREEIEDARIQSGFRRAEQKAQHVEARGTAHQRHRHRDHAPRRENPREPHARTEAAERKVARHFAQEVADEEQARAEPVCRVAEPDGRVHVQLREADHRAVDIRDHVDEREKRHEPAREQSHQLPFVDGCRRAGRGRGRCRGRVLRRRHPVSIDVRAGVVAGLCRSGRAASCRSRRLVPRAACRAQCEWLGTSAPRVPTRKSRSHPSSACST